MSNDFLYQDQEKVTLDHPDAAIRLASVVHRFRVPQMAANRKVRFASSFSTAGRHEKTRKLMLSADDNRQRLQEACEATKISSERVVADARRYIPQIHAILVSCKVQPENARLDQKLIFEWCSGIEDKKAKYFISEALMYDLTMAIACEGLGRAAAATENSVAGEFAAAARDYAAAAGIFEYLQADHLPKWISKGSAVDAELPSECSAASAKALRMLFQANGQQMAVATVLIKPGTPNYNLLAKLCLGIAEILEDFSGYLRREALETQSRMDKDFFTLVQFQIGVQKALSLYFQARALWEAMDYGIAIAIMSEATVELRTREAVGSRGLPDVSRIPTLKPLTGDLLDLRKHCQLVLQTWEKDNNSCYYQAVPQKVPAGKKLQEGLKMNRMEAYKLEDAEPHLLIIPEGELQRSDSDLARELQERLNASDD